MTLWTSLQTFTFDILCFSHFRMFVAFPLGFFLPGLAIEKSSPRCSHYSMATGSAVKSSGE